MKKAITRRTLADQDWKTQLAKGYSNIPSGVVVQVINDDFRNFYGSWYEVYWNNNHYYVEKDGLSFDYCKEDINTEVEKYKKFFK